MTMRGRRAFDWGAFVALTVHPTKAGIAEALRWIGRPLSASELQTIFCGQQSTGSIGHHLHRSDDDGVSGMLSEGERLEALQEQARKHTLRLKILALAQNRHQSLDPEDLRWELIERPAVTVIEYHLAVLDRAQLLPARVE